MSYSNNKLIILDRDGVINHDSDHYIKSPEEWLPIDGSLEAIALLNKAGYKIGVATNQSGIARGYYDFTTLEAMHSKMQQLLKNHGGRIDYIAYCPHGPDDNCSCRKPKPAMLLEIAKHFSVNPETVTFIGDTMSDMKAASAAEMQFALVRTGKGERTISSESFDHHSLSDISIYCSLNEYVNKLLKSN